MEYYRSIVFVIIVCSQFQLGHALKPTPYRGPVADIRSMQQIHEIPTIPGLMCALGPSTLGFGLGLFLAVSKLPRIEQGREIAEVHVPRGSFICDYSNGGFQAENKCDKTVRYTFMNPQREVFFRGQ